MAGLLRWLALRRQSVQVTVRGTDFHYITVTLFIMLLSHCPEEVTGLQSDSLTLSLTACHGWWSDVMWWHWQLTWHAVLEVISHIQTVTQTQSWNPSPVCLLLIGILFLIYVVCSYLKDHENVLSISPTFLIGRVWCKSILQGLKAVKVRRCVCFHCCQSGVIVAPARPEICDMWQGKTVLSLHMRMLT